MCFLIPTFDKLFYFLYYRSLETFYKYIIKIKTQNIHTYTYCFLKIISTFDKYVVACFYFLQSAC